MLFNKSQKSLVNFLLLSIPLPIGCSLFVKLVLEIYCSFYIFCEPRTFLKKLLNFYQTLILKPFKNHDLPYIGRLFAMAKYRAIC